MPAGFKELNKSHNANWFFDHDFDITSYLAGEFAGQMSGYDGDNRVGHISRSMAVISRPSTPGQVVVFANYLGEGLFSRTCSIDVIMTVRLGDLHKVILHIFFVVGNKDF